jgi:diguanylate cyclase (GGDEF)-like protein
LAATLQSAAIRFSRAGVEAITDGLTGLYNHRYLHERLEEELERGRRHDGKLSLLFCDCDHFKAYNDDHGHKSGDAALERIARIIETCSRRVDLAARYGGEEFVLVLVDTGGAGAMTVAGRIRSEVERVCIAGGYSLSVSIGVATYPDDAAAKDELLDKADWAMYAAKRAGRNRVCAFSDTLVRGDTWLSRRGRQAVSCPVAIRPASPHSSPAWQTPPRRQARTAGRGRRCRSLAQMSRRHRRGWVPPG